MDGTLQDDPRWRRLHEKDWVCPCCESKHAGLFDLACGKPEFWRGSEEKLPNADLLTARAELQDILTEDFCILGGEHFFVRAVLPFRIIGSADTEFRFGVWSTVSLMNFDRYVETFDGGEQGGLGPWFGWFSNRLEGYPDTLNLKCQVHPRFGRQRPRIELEPTDHPLAVENRVGITFDRLLEIYAINGHDMRRALCD